MRRRFLCILVTACVVAAFIVPLAAPGAGAAQWVQIGTPFWGNITSSIVYKSELYVGVLQELDLAPVGCQIWKYDGTDWLQVNENGFGDRENASAWSMEIYDGKLYVGTMCSRQPDYINSYKGCEVWRYDDGTDWTRVASAGFGDKNNKAAESMAVFDGKLYTGTWYCSGNPGAQDLCQVWRYDGSDWSRVPFSPPQNPEDPWSNPGDMLSMAVYESKLYAGVTGGGMVWRYDGEGWEWVNPGDFWQETWVAWPWCMEVYNGNLYVGTAMGNFGVLGCRVMRYDGSSWAEVSSPGFGDLSNTWLKFMCVYDGKLYAAAGASDLVVQMYSYEGGDWTKVDTSEFGSAATTGITSMTACETGMFTSTFTVSSGSAVTSDTPGARGAVSERRAAVAGGPSIWMQGRFPPKPSTTFYFAEGTCRPNFDPYLCIQNPGGEDAQVKITYMKGNGATDEQTLTVGRNSRSTVVVKDKLGEGDDPAHDFSCKVESTNAVNIIAERPMYFNYKGAWTGGHDVMGALSPSTTFYFAEGTCRPNFDPYFCIQNPGEADAQVKITYMKGDGTTDSQDVTVAKNSRSTVVVKDKLGQGDNPAHDFSAKVECTNGQSILVERPMYFNYMGDWTGGHDVVGALSPATTFYFAEGTCRPGFDPYICIQNPGSADANVTITYMKGDGSTDTQTLTVGKNSRSTVVVKDRLGTADDVAHDFSAKVECTNGQAIIAERPMYFNYQSKWTGGHDVVGAFAAAPTFYFAEGTCRPGFDPYFCIQNPGAADAQVRITYMKGDGTTDTQDILVSKNSRSTVVVKDRLGTADDAAHDFSATVECINGESIIAERPMYFNYQSKWTGGHDVVGFTP